VGVVTQQGGQLRLALEHAVHGGPGQRGETIVSVRHEPTIETHGDSNRRLRTLRQSDADRAVEGSWAGQQDSGCVPVWYELGEVAADPAP
jgi:hypothetical protein